MQKIEEVVKTTYAIVKTMIALICYCIAIALLTVCAITIVIKLIFWPPCTQAGNVCVIDGWSVAGLAGTVLGVAATVLAILGAVAVAAWWTSLDKQVTKRVNKLYSRQKVEIDKTLLAQQGQIEKQSQEKLDKTIYEFEESITESFAAQGPLLAEPIAQKAIAAGRYPTFPFYMTKSYLNLFQQEDRLPSLKQHITSYQESIENVRSYVNSDIDLSRMVPRTNLENHKKTLSSYLESFNPPNNSTLVLMLDEWHRTVNWWKAAKNNQPKTPSLKPEDFVEGQKEFDLYSTEMQKAEQDFDKIKSDAQSLILYIEDLLQEPLK